MTFFFSPFHGTPNNSTGMKLELDRIPTVRRDWGNDQIAKAANYLVNVNPLDALIALNTSNTSLEEALDVWVSKGCQLDGAAEGDKGDEGGAHNTGVSVLIQPLHTSGSIQQILDGKEEEEDHTGAASTSANTQKQRRTHQRNTSLLARIPASEESYFIETQNGTTGTSSLQGPFSRKEMRDWCDQKVIEKSSLLRVVVTHPTQFAMAGGGDPMAGTCPFPNTKEQAPTCTAEALFPDWFRAFRDLPVPPKAGRRPKALSIRDSSSTATTTMPFPNHPANEEAVPPPVPVSSQQSRRSQRPPQSVQSVQPVLPLQPVEPSSSVATDDDETSSFPSSMDVSIPRTIDAYHTYADEKGRADARAAHKTSDPLMYTRLVQVEMERDTLLATLEANQEDTNHVEKFKQEILHLKMVREQHQFDGCLWHCVWSFDGIDT